MAVQRMTPIALINSWFCKYPVTLHVGTFLDRAVASLWLRRVSTLWQLLRKRRHRRDIGHVGYSVRHLISPIQIHSVRSLHSLWYLSFIACWTQQGILNFQLNFLNLPMVAGEKTNILWALQKRADMLQLHRPYHYCQAAPGMNIVARVSGSLESMWNLSWSWWLDIMDFADSWLITNQ